MHIDSKIGHRDRQFTTLGPEKFGGSKGSIKQIIGTSGLQSTHDKLADYIPLLSFILRLKQLKRQAHSSWLRIKYIKRRVMQAKYDLIYKNFVLIPVAIAHWVTIKRTHAQQPVGKPKYVRIGCVLNTIRKYKDILKKPGA